jgi:hypothetical protein
MTDEELNLTHGNAQLRNAVTEALRLHPESDSAITVIVGKLDTTAGSPDKIELLKRVRDNLREREDILIKRHPDVEDLFKNVP